MNLRTKRVGGEKTETLTLTKTETNLLERAMDLLRDIAKHGNDKLTAVADLAASRIEGTLTLVEGKEPHPDAEEFQHRN